MSDLGPLVPADEGFHHQVTDTFATVGTSDRSWTEKVFAMAAAKDGSLQLVFGIGKYPNRGVLDAFAGISRGVEQWTVRASRELGADGTTAAGPLRYAVDEPLRRVTFALDANDVVPVAFEWTLDGVTPPFLEEREQHRSPDRFRIDADIVRYHQAGVARGWVELDGRRIEVDDRSWVSTRDHSWGVRYMVGEPAPDVAPVPFRDQVASLILWCPIACERADGTRYALHWYYQSHAFGDVFRRVEVQGGVEHPDGRKEAFVAAVPGLRFDPANRRFRGGTIRFTRADGTDRTLSIEPVSDTGFHLGTGLYFGFGGQWHGQWRGPLHVDGEHIADCSDPETARRVHQMRSCVVRVDDPAEGGTGYGDLQSLVLGEHPDMGLSADSSFM